MTTGDCGPPIETDAGWPVLTHCVGPMRAYCGALKHGDTLVIPYGFGDKGTEFATAPISELLAVVCS